MSATLKIEEKIQRTERKLKELSILLQRLTEEYNEVLKEMALTPSEIKEYVENPNNFAPNIWEEMQEDKKKWEEKLDLELKSLPNIQNTKKNMAEKGQIQQHWLFVR